MATMVKEKRKDKKKKKEKCLDPVEYKAEIESIPEISNRKDNDNSSKNVVDVNREKDEVSALETKIIQNELPETPRSHSLEPCHSNTSQEIENPINEEIKVDKQEISLDILENISNLDIKEVNLPLQTIEDSQSDSTNKIIDIDQQSNVELTNTGNVNITTNEESADLETQVEEEIPAPSAPVFYEPEIAEEMYLNEEVIEEIVQINSLPLVEAVRIFGEREIQEIKAVSEREEAIVENGPGCGPEHPLVDLLYTFRSSLNKIHQNSISISRGYAEEKKYRNNLWIITQEKYSTKETCKCGTIVPYRFTYERAEFLKSKLPIAKMKLEGLLRDVQESYCHHLHSALMVQCQIEDLLSTITQSNKGEIRTAVSLILQELRLCDDKIPVLSESLLRWAKALVASLLAGGDVRQLMFLIHHLFRQSRSVSWAADLISFTVRDMSQAAQAIAIMEILLTHVGVSSATECIEEYEEMWEEVGVGEGGEGAVRDGAVRERDLCALLRAVNLQQVIATISCSQYQSGEAPPAHSVLRAVCGARSLLATLHGGGRAHARYSRLAALLLHAALAAAAPLHHACMLHRDTFPFEIRDLISSELETVFASTFSLWMSSRATLPDLPFRMLSDQIAVACSTELQKGIHETKLSTIKCLRIEMGAHVTCDVIVRLLSMIAIDRRGHSSLAHSILEFIFKLGILKQTASCSEACDKCASAAKEELSKILAIHPYLYTDAFLLVGNLAQDNYEMAIKVLAPDKWRPTPADINCVLGQYSLQCARIVPVLLLSLDYTPHTGVSLETQLTITQHISSLLEITPDPPEWVWAVLSREEVHLARWGAGLEAPAPAADVGGLCWDMITLMTTSWGHCLPLICEYGVACLLRLVAGGRLREAAHCLAPIMIVLTQSPESISYTKQFNELFTTFVAAGPSLVQRALGRASTSGAKLLLNLILQQLSDPNQRMNVPASSVWEVWLHALWPSGAGRQLLETAACAGADLAPVSQPLTKHAVYCYQVDPCSIVPIMGEASSTPALTLAALWAGAGAGAGRGALLDAVHLQRCNNVKIHVDNALKSIGSTLSSEDLLIHKTAAAALAAPLSHPAHLSLWCLFFQLYAEKPPSFLSPTTLPIGPLFFKGIIKSRTFAQLKKRLQETITYHQIEITKLRNEQLAHFKTKETDSTTEPSSISSGKLTQSFNLFEQLNSILTLEISDEPVEDSTIDVLSSEESVKMAEKKNSDAILEKSLQDLISYHNISKSRAEIFLRWLEDDDKVMQFHVEYLTPISDLEIAKPAWQAEYRRRAPPSSPGDELLTPLPTAGVASVVTPTTPLQRVVESLNKYTRYKSSEPSKIILKPLLQESILRDRHKIYKCIDENLIKIQECASEWCEELSRACALDLALWPLVSTLRLPRSLPPARVQCPRCSKHVTIVLPIEEWCVCERAMRGVEENRRSGAQALATLARARPGLARAVATLQTLARQVTDAQTAIHFMNELWRYGNIDVQHMSTLGDIADILCQRFISHDAALCSKLLQSWCKAGVRVTALRQTLAGALVTPRQVVLWHSLYATVAELPLPQQTVFSFLSKFEISRLAPNLTNEQRKSTLNIMLNTAERLANSDDSYQMLLELVCLHVSSVSDRHTLRQACVQAARVMSDRLCVALCAQLQKAIEACAPDVDFDELGHLLRELGSIYWIKRTTISTSQNRNESKTKETENETTTKDNVEQDHPSHVAAQLRAIFAAFVSAAYAQQFTVERVVWFAWSALLEAWSAWVQPRAGTSLLLPPAHTHSHLMLTHFVCSVTGVMSMCAGCECYILQELFEWTGQTILENIGPAVSQENSGQLSLLLTEELGLSWHEHQWFDYRRCIDTLLKLCTIKDTSIVQWLCHVLRATQAQTWLSETSEMAAPVLDTLFYVLTTLPFHKETLERACSLPWFRLPAAALQPALERFFADHYNVSEPYHALPSFCIVLHASELIAPAATAGYSPRIAGREKRALCVSLWTRAAAARDLCAGVGGATHCLLHTLTCTAPHIESSELVDLLTRAMAILYTDPSSAAALPCWERFIKSTSHAMLCNTLVSLGALTSLEHFAHLGDIAAKTLMTQPESEGWAEIRRYWATSHWRECSPLLSRGRLYAAYAVTVSFEQGFVPTLHNMQIDFVESEVIIATWICYLCRAECERAKQPHASNTGESETTLCAWSKERKSSLLRAFALRGSNDQPTDRHRLLCRYAQCILNPESDATMRSFEASYTAVLGSNPAEVGAFTSPPLLKNLVKLAIKLYPSHEKYFGYEKDLISNL